jgi:hypothetical protein
MKFLLDIRFFILLILLLTSRCKEVYIPPSVPLNSSYLVVDGMLFTGNDSSVIHLTRSRSLADTVPPIAEPNAQVAVVGAGGVVYPFTDEGNGYYSINQLPLDISQKYNLQIKTTDGNEYLSDSVPVLTTPPIGSVYWTQDAAGVHILLNTGDPQNITRYYRWEYVETWEYQTAYPSFLEYLGNGQTAFRPQSEQIFTCYQFAYATDINVINTNNLSQDIVSQQPITLVPTGSEKISAEYSILVKQYAMTQDAYTFWHNLKANSEDLGSLFDQQPYTQLGNFHCVNNPAIPVIGFAGICALQQQRIFINYREVPVWNYSPYYGSCTDTTYVSNQNQLEALFPPSGLDLFTLLGTSTKGWVYTTNVCGDCRVHGGTTTKPSYMP